MKKEFFPDQWIAPGEYVFCRKCGMTMLPPDKQVCLKCRHTPSLSDFVCGICGKVSEMMFVHGYRCNEHAFQKEPSQIFEGENIAGCLGKIRSGWAIPHEEIAREQEESRRLLEERNTLAESRRASGVPALFWMKQMEKAN